MGNFVNYMYMFASEYNHSNKIFSRKEISKWFNDKKAVKRNNSVAENIGKQKNAVVVAGVSCIGKSTYVEEFQLQHPEFEVISYDEAFYQETELNKINSETTQDRVVRMLEEQMLNCRDKNIIVDPMCINPASRAALLRFLTELGYEIHLIFFTQAYTEANIKQCITNRAIEITLCQNYLAKMKGKNLSMNEIMMIRNDILNICAEEKGISIDELKMQTAKLIETTSCINTLMRCYEEEVEKHRVWWQEKRELFMLGADYYYER